jgi:hypothetical protein
MTKEDSKMKLRPKYQQKIGCFNDHTSPRAIVRGGDRGSLGEKGD